MDDDDLRVAVRILVLDAASRVLLFEGRDLGDPTDATRFWFTAGGGVDDGESLRQAATRELAEETGLSLMLVGPFHRRDVTFLNHGAPLRQVEHFFAARADVAAVSTDGWTSLEQQVVTRWRWWSAADLEATDATYYPENLADLLRRAREFV